VLTDIRALADQFLIAFPNINNWLKALINIEENKNRFSRWYDKKVKAKEFADGN